MSSKEQTRVAFTCCGAVARTCTKSRTKASTQDNTMTIVNTHNDNTKALVPIMCGDSGDEKVLRTVRVLQWAGPSLPSSDQLRHVDTVEEAILVSRIGDVPLWPLSLYERIAWRQICQLRARHCACGRIGRSGGASSAAAMRGGVDGWVAAVVCVHGVVVDGGGVWCFNGL